MRVTRLATTAATLLLACVFALLLFEGCSEDDAGSVPAAELKPRPWWFPDRDDGLRVRVPPGWRVSGESLTRVVNPREVLTAATFPMPAGGRCPHMPRRAVMSMGSDDALVSIQEARPHDPASFPPRPPRFRLAADNGVECVSRDGFRTSWIAFSDGFRSFYALVVVGKRAALAEARRLLDSFTLTRLTTPGAKLGQGTKHMRCGRGFIGASAADWRSRANAAGPIGLWGRGRRFDLIESRDPSDGLFHTKTPVIVEGHRVVRLAVPAGAREQVGLDVDAGGPYAQLVFHPCPEKPRTTWAMGWVLLDRSPVSLRVRWDGGAALLAVGEGK